MPEHLGLSPAGGGIGLVQQVAALGTRMDDERQEGNVEMSKTCTDLGHASISNRPVEVPCLWFAVSPANFEIGTPDP
jgi:hypothetical protein